MMSLRGGLLAETTWALDTINIMLADDQTHTYFRLKQMPGLLPALVDVYLKCLSQLFEEFQNSPSNIENQQPSLNDLNGSSHLTCTTRRKHEPREQESIIYRVESNSLNKYKRKYYKEQSIVYDRVYDEQGNEKHDPTYVLDLQNTDDLCYLRTHFDPLRLDDQFYEKLYYGNNNNDNDRMDEKMSTNSISDEHEHDSEKRLKTSEDDLSVNHLDNGDSSKATPPSAGSDRHHRQNSDSLIDISDNNQEFLQRYKRKFEYDEKQNYELYPGICSSSKSNEQEFHSCTTSNDQQENVLSLFTYY